MLLYFFILYDKNGTMERLKKIFIKKYVFIKNKAKTHNIIYKRKKTSFRSAVPLIKKRGLYERKGNRK